MKCTTIITTVALACSAFTSINADTTTAAPGKTWSYKTNDASVYGPSEWGLLKPDCGGKRQSPIAILTKAMCGNASVPGDKSPLEFSGECAVNTINEYDDAYKASAIRGMNTCKVTVKGKSFEYVQSHFHAPAEHTLDGKIHDGEIHFVHSSNGENVVVGVFLQKKAGATTDPYLLKFFEQTPNVVGKGNGNTTLGSFFPAIEPSIKAGRVFNYPGSLTNPPCTEAVDWWVVEKPVVVSAADFEKMQTQLPRLAAATADGKTARPTQPLNGRTIAMY